jgi:REP element-mobilizing transposase RayT
LAGPRGQDHIHLRIRILPQSEVVAAVLGSSKGKKAIAVARQGGGGQSNLHGARCWAKGYTVATVGFEEAHMRVYNKPQEQRDAQGWEEPGAG